MHSALTTEDQAFLAAEDAEIASRFHKETLRSAPLRYLSFPKTDNRDRTRRKMRPHDPALTERIRKDIEG